MRPGLAIALTLVAAGCSDGASPEPGEELSGGSSTVFDVSRDSFSFASPALKDDRRNGFFVGNALFNRNWVTAPASSVGVDGLGPTFNATSCSSCHLKDGRGQPPSGTDPALSLLVRLSVPGTDAHGGPLPEPTYGGQLQNASILNVPTEGQVRIEYDEVPGSYADGTTYSLRRPRYRFDALAFGPMAADVMFSPRVAPANFGLGLLEAIPEADLLAHADPDDADGDGISGRANQVWDQLNGRVAMGRFGWKANQPSIRQQTAGAFQGDIGITSTMDPEENCPSSQPECAAAPNGGAPELDPDKLDDVTFYGQTLAVPGRRNVGDGQVLAGKALFNQIGCASCHVPRFVTGPHEVPEVVGQTIFPYTDLLLHDLGEGLADGRPDFLATGREWRTAPLWGVGLIPIVNLHDFLLHDGRARGLAEAILWHGGEGEAAKEAFRTLPADDRAALVTFLESL